MAHSRPRGFTLLELLIVIAILALLAALLFPTFAEARGRARRTACLSQLKQLAYAHQIYLQDYDDRFPNWRLKVSDDRAQLWMETLRPYYRDERLLHDPGVSWGGTTAPRTADYALCTWGPACRGTAEDPYYHWPGPSVTMAQVRRPDQIIALADGWTTEAWTVADGWRQSSEMPGHRLRHGSGLNATFVDGHARWMTAEEVWRVTADENGYHWLAHGTVDR